jgi:type I restriction enzyme R subunit
VIEAKPEGITLVEVEHQSGRYVTGLPAWMKPPVYPLPFIYESTTTETRFTNGYDPDARSRRVFSFHRPETLAEWARQIIANPEAPTFRARLRTMPELDNPRLWEVQATAIRKLEGSLREDRPRALIQMATGSGKTFTAANLCHRLIRHADAKWILFLVDRSNFRGALADSSTRWPFRVRLAGRRRHHDPAAAHRGDGVDLAARGCRPGYWSGRP